jgi:hypothetical protein
MSDDRVALDRRIRKLEATLEALAARERVIAASGGLLSTGVVYVTAAGTLTTEADFAYIAADNELRTGRVRLAEQATPTTPASGFGLVFADATGIPRGVDDAGAVRQMVPSATSTYTPTYTGATTPGVTTYSVQVGRYRLLADNLCWFYARVDWTNATGTGLAQVSLPFTSRNIASGAQSIRAWCSNVTFAGTGLVCVVNPNSAVAFIGTLNSNAATATITVETAGTIILAGVYEVA